MSPRRIMRNVLADKPSPVATPNVFVRNDALLLEQQQQQQDEAVARNAASASSSAPPLSSSRRQSLSRDSGIFGSSARTPRSLLRHALPGLPSSFPTPPTPTIASPSFAAPSPLAEDHNASASSFQSPLAQPSLFTRPFTSPSPTAFDHQLPFTPPATSVPFKRGRGRPSAAAVAALSKPPHTITTVGGAAAADSASTPVTASKSSRRDVPGALPHHVTKELFVAQCQSIAVSSSAVGKSYSLAFEPFCYPPDNSAQPPPPSSMCVLF
jgi:hypothetical protein